MYEKILQKLKEQRGTTSNVSDRSLEDLARSLVTVITTDEILEVADLSAAIKSIDGNINHYTKSQLEKIKKDEDDTKAKAEADRIAKEASDKAKADGTPDIGAEVAAAVAEAMKPLMGELSALKSEKSTTNRKTKLETALKDTPEYFKKPILAAFSKTKFDGDEQFTEYLSEVESSRDGFIQTAKEEGLPISIPDLNVRKPVEDGQTTSLSEAAAMVAKAKVDESKLNS